MFKWLKSLFAKRETVIEVPNREPLSIGIYNGCIVINGKERNDDITVGVQNAPDPAHNGDFTDYPCIVTCVNDGDLDVHPLNAVDLLHELARMLEYRVEKL